MKLPARVLCYGSSLPLPRTVPLRAGPLRLLFEGGDLRYVRLGDIEILRRVYGAVRDQNWGTPRGTLSDLRIERGKQSFEIRYRSTHRKDPIDFVWDAIIRGDASGTVHFAMNGVARSTFLRSRIGLCVLHPVHECSGVTCKVEHAGGVAGAAIFPKKIGAELPIPGFFEMRALSYEAAPDLRAELSFEGDLFEMEDQRNWTDASFKTFSTPANLPIPVKVKEGTTISQSVTLRFQGRFPPVESRAATSAVHISLARKLAGRLPRIGFGVASHDHSLSRQEIERLKVLRPSHLRADIDFSKPDWRESFERGARESGMLDTALEVALIGADPEELTALAKKIRRNRARISAWLLFPASAKGATVLRRMTPGAKIGAGTNSDFYFLNQAPPDGRLVDIATYAIHPQTHATDNRSLVETLAVQAETVANARRLAAGLPVMVSPVTLKPRFNPDAIAPEPPPPPGELPPQVDPRQMSLLAACWTIGSIKHLAEAGAFSATFYETTGWRGLMELGEGSTLPGKFRSMPGSVFPLYHVFADVAEFAGGRVLPLQSTSPLAVDGIAMRKERRTRVILANFTDDAQRVVLPGVMGQVRLLDERSVIDAMTSPDRFRSRKGRPVRLTKLVLPRYALARIDLREHS